MIVAAATLYACRQRRSFWPTMLGVTSEQCHQGGESVAHTAMLISGIGMISGWSTLVSPFIGAFLADRDNVAASFK